MEVKKIISALMLGSFIMGSSISMNVHAEELKNVSQEMSNSLSSVEKLGNGKISLKFEQDVSGLSPSLFDISGKTRLVLDLPKVKNGSKNKYYGIADDDFIQKVTVIEVEEKTRVVVDLKQKARFDFKKQGNEFNISFAKVDSEQQINEKDNVAEVNSQYGTKLLDRLLFSRGANKVGKLVVEISDKNFTPNITKNGNVLSIDLGEISVPETMQKKLAVANINTQVQNIDVVTQGKKAKINLEIKDKWDYSSYQADGKLVVEVKPMTEYEAIVKEEKEKAGYKGKPITLNFQDIEVRTILQVIGDFTGLNMVSSDRITNKMTIRLKDVPWDQALDLILESNNLEKQKNGNIIWIATRQEIVEKQDLQKKQKDQQEQIKPLKMEIFSLNHHKADKLYQMIKGTASASGGTGGGGSSNSSSLSFLSSRGKATFDIRNNVLVVEDVEERLEEIRKLVKRLDQNVRQVLVEAKIVIADDKFSRDLGAKFGVLAGKNLGSNNRVSIGGNNNATTQVVNGAYDPNNQIPYMSSFPAGTGAAALAFSFLNLKNGNILNFELSAMEKNNRGRIVSSPRLMTTDNQKATIEQGTEIPYVTPGTANAPATVSFKKAVLSLGVTPQIAPNGKVIMDLDVIKDSVGEYVSTGNGGMIPSIDTKNIHTQVTVNDGQTVVLGGVVENLTRNDISKVPFLGDIPVVGHFFKQTMKAEDKAEVLIFLTPYVITEDIMDVAAMDDGVPMSVELKR